MKKVYVLLMAILCFQASFAALSKKDPLAKFSGRVSNLNLDARLVRFKVNFDNIKFLNKGDEVDFWGQHQERNKCSGKILGRSSDYLLVKVYKIEWCNEQSPMALGRFFHFYSVDLSNNISVARKLTEILLKKRLALEGKVQRNKKLIETYLQRVEAVNNRYELLRRKLEQEWREELTKLEEDQIEIVRNTNGLEVRLNETNHKLELYQIEDNNLKLDRWSLDKTLYYEK
ncbi:MAG: hypothetical protein CME69_10030 [Halobacteriovorax sp.]|nr:hypothetical protein [Halobacteriovorax sp.]MEE3079250.1 hypothetical protein [Bdellovibrionota bacterium]